jgi:Leucine-rich repeat (LRR) protein
MSFDAELVRERKNDDERRQYCLHLCSDLADVAYVSRVREISLIRCNLSEIPESLAHAVRVKRLSLSENCIAELGPLSLLSALAQLRRLDLSWNRIEAIRNNDKLDGNGNCGSCGSRADVTVQVRVNDKVVSPQQCCYVKTSWSAAFASLEELLVEGNCLARIDERTVGSLRTLSYLNLSYNSLDALPDDLSALAPTLEHFVVHGNIAMRVPAALRSMSSMRVLAVDRDDVIVDGVAFNDLLCRAPLIWSPLLCDAAHRRRKAHRRWHRTRVRSRSRSPSPSIDARRREHRQHAKEYRRHRRSRSDSGRFALDFGAGADVSAAGLMPYDTSLATASAARADGRLQRSPSILARGPLVPDQASLLSSGLSVMSSSSGALATSESDDDDDDANVDDVQRSAQDYVDMYERSTRFAPAHVLQAPFADNFGGSDAPFVVLGWRDPDELRSLIVVVSQRKSASLGGNTALVRSADGDSLVTLPVPHANEHQDSSVETIHMALQKHPDLWWWTHRRSGTSMRVPGLTLLATDPSKASAAMHELDSLFALPDVHSVGVLAVLCPSMSRNEIYRTRLPSVAAAAPPPPSTLPFAIRWGSSLRRHLTLAPPRTGGSDGPSPSAVSSPAPPTAPHLSSGDEQSEMDPADDAVNLFRQFVAWLGAAGGSGGANADDAAALISAKVVPNDEVFFNIVPLMMPGGADGDGAADEGDDFDGCAESLPSSPSSALPPSPRGRTKSALGLGGKKCSLASVRRKKESCEVDALPRLPRHRDADAKSSAESAPDDNDDDGEHLAPMPSPLEFAAERDAAMHAIDTLAVLVVYLAAGVRFDPALVACGNHAVIVVVQPECRRRHADELMVRTVVRQLVDLMPPILPPLPEVVRLSNLDDQRRFLLHIVNANRVACSLREVRAPVLQHLFAASPLSMRPTLASLSASSMRSALISSLDVAYVPPPPPRALSSDADLCVASSPPSASAATNRQRGILTRIRTLRSRLNSKK